MSSEYYIGSPVENPYQSADFDGSISGPSNKIKNRIISEFSPWLEPYPRFVCKEYVHFEWLTQHHGYRVRHRDRRCSIICRKALLEQESICANRRLDDLDDRYTLVRGNMFMPTDSTPQDHTKVKHSFGDRLGYRRRRHGVVFEFKAWLHPTDRDNCHWDYVGYANISADELRDLLIPLWRKSGGDGDKFTCRPMDEPEIKGSTKYAAKDLKKDKDPPYQFKTGFDATWTSEHFYGPKHGGKKPDDYWREFIEEIKSKSDEKREPMGQYVPMKDRDKDRVSIVEQLPNKPEKSVGLSILTEQWQMPMAYIKELLDESPEVRKTTGTIINGHHYFNGYWRDDGMVQACKAASKVVRRDGLVPGVPKLRV